MKLARFVWVIGVLGASCFRLTGHFNHHSHRWLEYDDREKLQAQSKQDGLCGAGRGTCAQGHCCSAEGWCGLGKDYCRAPDCQWEYGDGCDGNRKPNGRSTEDIPRPFTTTEVLYGGIGITSCSVPNTVALTFDDGPYNYTNYILDLLDSYNAKATFFITGNNIGKGAIDDPSTLWPGILHRMYNSNHQLASHTWSHQDLSLMPEQLLKNQIYYNEMAFRNVLGFFPQYMRPPYSSCNAACQQFLEHAGYHVIYFDLDTEDYLNDDATLIQISKDNIYTNFTTANNTWLVIEHDIHFQSAYNLTENILQQVQAKGFRPVTVGECLGDDKINWYRWEQDRYPTSTTGRCGNAFQSTCWKSAYGECCSEAGWCGSSEQHCQSGCQVEWGICGGQRVVNNETMGASTDGVCGPESGYTCTNSTHGTCCSDKGWCGTGQLYCFEGCQKEFGACST